MEHQNRLLLKENIIERKHKASFPLVDFFARTGFFRRYIILRNNINYLAEVAAKKKGETLSTFEKRKNSLTN